jgi:hypothetical protein
MPLTFFHMSTTMNCNRCSLSAPFRHSSCTASKIATHTHTHTHDRTHTTHTKARIIERCLECLVVEEKGKRTYGESVWGANGNADGARVEHLHLFRQLDLGEELHHLDRLVELGQRSVVHHNILAHATHTRHHTTRHTAHDTRHERT